MNRITLDIPLPELQAIALFASRDATRYTLNAVCLRMRSAGHPVNLYATDGRRLAALKSAATIQVGEPPAEDFNVLIPTALIKLAKPWDKKSKRVLLHIEEIEQQPMVVNTTKRYKLTFDDITQQVSRKSIDGNYPTLKGVWLETPMVLTETALCINAQLFGELHQAMKILRPKMAPAVKLASSGPGKAIVAVACGVEEFYCMIMSVRSESDGTPRASTFNTPLWIDMTPVGPAVTSTGKPAVTP